MSNPPDPDLDPIADGDAVEQTVTFPNQPPRAAADPAYRPRRPR